MKQKIFLLLLSGVSVLAIVAFTGGPANEKELTGAWLLKQGQEEQVLLFADGYFTHTTYDKTARRFVQTRGGSYTVNRNKLSILYEFDTRQAENIGQTSVYAFSQRAGKLKAGINGRLENWQQIDQGNAGLHGLWKITARKGEGGLVPIHQTGTRKTIKILTGTRFQWAAIDPGTKQFMGTGGGTYSFANGKYTEHIEFFSRDSSRTGSSLSFDGKLENGDWHHSGLSSKGDLIYEVWSRNK